jgi:uncharacterized protein involved in exopolysaccharide biosynthesis
VVRVVRQNRRLFLLLPLALAFVGALIAVFTPITYTSAATFMPTTASRSSGALASLGAQFGLALPGNDPSQSPAFYVDLLQSEVLLGQLLRREYQAAPDAPKRALADLYEVQGKTPAERDDNTIRKLKREVTAAANQKTGVVKVSVRAPTAYLAQQVATELLGALDRFNNERRRSGARAERQFTEQRLRTVTDELRQAEDRLLDFRTRNLDFRSASRLQVEETRLQRNVGLLTQLQSSLAQGFEQARIDEVRDTPLISPIEAPSRPVRRDSRGLVRLALTGGVLGLMLALALSLTGRALAPRRPPSGQPA